MMNSAALILLSGGTTTVINSTLAGAITAAQRIGVPIYAGINGIAGAMQGNLVDLTKLSENQLQLLRYTPASGSVGASRFPVLSSDDICQLSCLLESKKIKYVLNVGGNGTIQQSILLSKEIEGLITVAVPKTVDNDFGDQQFEIMHYNPGFPSCVNYWCHKLAVYNQENLGAFQHDRVLIAQTFGRKTGFLAGACRLADPDREIPLILLLPEDQQSVEAVAAKIDDTLLQYSRSVVVICEGYEIGDIGARYDYVGQVQYGSSLSTSANLLSAYLNNNNIQARTIIPGPDQRCENSLSICSDFNVAFDLGAAAIDWAVNSDESFLVGIAAPKNGLNNPAFNRIPLAGLGDMSRQMPAEWIRSAEFDVSDEYIHYLSSIADELSIESVQCRNAFYKMSPEYVL